MQDYFAPSLHLAAVTVRLWSEIEIINCLLNQILVLSRTD
jgi:hypothetical protein